MHAKKGKSASRDKIVEVKTVGISKVKEEKH